MNFYFHKDVMVRCVMFRCVYLSENLIVLFSESNMPMRVETTSFVIVENTTKIIFFRATPFNH